MTKYGFDLQTFKHDVLENLGLQISEVSRHQTPFTSLLLARSLVEFLP